MRLAELEARRLRSQRAFYRAVTPCSPGGRVLELHGVTAAIVPAVPERSVFNGVVYEDGSALLEAVDDLARGYDDAGVDAWTVWVQPRGDDRVTAALAALGHVLDATPESMGRSLQGAVRPDPDPLAEWSRDGDAADVAAINDRAYPFGGDPFSRGWRELPPAVRRYVARVDGVAAACVATHDHEGDCGVYMVATLPEARGRGFVTALLAHAMADARERGCETTTLEATPMGRPVYERLGYQPLGALGMWERRRGG